MAKIAKVITSCNDCEHLTILQEQRGNTKFATICEYENKDEVEKPPPFMIDFFHDEPKHYKNLIPPNCPLEDYKPTKTEQ